MSLSPMSFSQLERRRTEKWLVRRVSDDVLIALASSEEVAERMAGYLNRSAKDGQTFRHHRRGVKK